MLFKMKTSRTVVDLQFAATSIGKSRQTAVKSSISTIRLSHQAIGAVMSVRKEEHVLAQSPGTPLFHYLVGLDVRMIHTSSQSVLVPRAWALPMLRWKENFLWSTALILHWSHLRKCARLVTSILQPTTADALRVKLVGSLHSTPKEHARSAMVPEAVLLCSCSTAVLSLVQ